MALVTRVYVITRTTLEERAGLSLPHIITGAPEPMPRLQFLFHLDGWTQLSIRRLRPDFTSGQIHRWRIRLGPVEIRGWRSFITPNAI